MDTFGVFRVIPAGIADYLRVMKEPAYINYERRRGGEPVLEIAGLHRRPDQHEFIMVCHMGNKTVLIKWYARNAEEARWTFRDQLTETWLTLTTDLGGYSVPNGGFDFKAGRIDSFGIVGEE